MKGIIIIGLLLIVIIFFLTLNYAQNETTDKEEQ